MSLQCLNLNGNQFIKQKTCQHIGCDTPGKQRLGQSECGLQQVGSETHITKDELDAMIAVVKKLGFDVDKICGYAGSAPHVRPEC